jgi:hypothetical protein
VALIGFSPELRKQSLLPAYPAHPIRVVRRCGSPAAQPGFGAGGFGGIALASIHLMVEARLWEDGLRSKNFSRYPGVWQDFLMDRKGDDFRRRPVSRFQQATVQAIDEGNC